MKFSVSHVRAFIGSDVSVEVVADDKETIRSVSIDLDGWTLEAESFGEGRTQYKREFNRVGDANTGMDHVLLVSAMDQDLNPHSSETIWTD